MSTDRQAYEKHKSHINFIMQYNFDTYKNVCDQAIASSNMYHRKKTELKEVGIQRYKEKLISALALPELKNEITQEEIEHIFKFTEQIMKEDGMFLSDIAGLRRNKRFKALVELYEDEYKLPDIGKKNIWDEVEKAALLVHQDLSSNDPEYLTLKENIAKLTKEENEASFKFEKLKKEIAGSISEDLDEKALKKLCDQMEPKPIEVLVFESDKMDEDLGAVIRMRVKEAARKGHELILLSFDKFQSVMHTGHSLEGVDKLSFLHHGESELGYVDNIQHYINHMPQLKEIVIRECGTGYSFDKETIYKAKMTETSYDKVPSIQGDEQILIQQKQDNDKIYTKVSWAVRDPVTHKRRIEQISDITHVSKIQDKKPTDQQLQELEQIKGMPLLEHSREYTHSMRETFFSNKAFSLEDHARIKKAVPRARTASATIRSEEGLLSRVLNKMSPEQRQRVSVKAYLGGYKVSHGYVIPTKGHGRDAVPKAVRFGPKPVRRDRK